MARREVKRVPAKTVTVKSPNEIAKLKKKSGNNMAGKRRLMEMEKILPLKKRSVRISTDYPDTSKKASSKKEEPEAPPKKEAVTNRKVKKTKGSAKRQAPPQQREITPPIISSPSPLSTDREPLPSPSSLPDIIIKQEPHDSDTSIDSDNTMKDVSGRKKNFVVLISKEDQRRAQDVWCEAMWNKLHPGEPFNLLKSVQLERHPLDPLYTGPEMNYYYSETSSSSSCSTCSSDSESDNDSSSVSSSSSSDTCSTGCSACNFPHASSCSMSDSSSSSSSRDSDSSDDDQDFWQQHIEANETPIKREIKKEVKEEAENE